MRWRGLAVFLLLSGAADAADEVSFARDLKPLLRTNCATCHLTGEESGKMKLYPAAAYESLVNAQSIQSTLKRVQPGAPEQSYLLHKLDGTHLEVGGVGEQMPFGQPPLTQVVRDLFRAWIKEGARDN